MCWDLAAKPQAFNYTAAENTPAKARAAQTIIPGKPQKPSSWCLLLFYNSIFHMLEEVLFASKDMLETQARDANYAAGLLCLCINENLWGSSSLIAWGTWASGRIGRDICAPVHCSVLKELDLFWKEAKQWSFFFSERGEAFCGCFSWVRWGSWLSLVD